jgi:hypothetical protein
MYCGAYSVEAHKADFRKQLRECIELLQQVQQGGLINVHAGVDAWSDDEACDFLEFCLSELAQVAVVAPSFTSTLTSTSTSTTSSSIPVTFETHRQRLFGNPFQTQRLLSLPSLSKIRLNADLSHWYCACERVFDETEERDAHWWPTMVRSILATKCDYIHARFGWAQGPQMADPSAVECEWERLLQINVWRVLLQQQIKVKGSSGVSDAGGDGGGGAGGRHRQCNNDVFVCPEYGPVPYMAVMPHTQKSVASLPDAVAYTKNIIEELFESICKSNENS